MGKNNRLKKQGRLKPDEVVTRGPIQMVRFGKLTVMNNNMNADQHKLYMEHLVTEYPKIISEIDALVHSAVDSINQYEPLELLRYAFGAFASKALGKVSEYEWSNDDSSYIYTLEYIQSVIASSGPEVLQYRDISPDDFEAIRNTIKQIYQKSALDFQMASTAKRNLETDDSSLDKSYEELYVLSQMYWIRVRNSRFSVHHKPFLETILRPHDSVLKELWNLDSNDISKQIESILISLRSGLINAAIEIREIQTQSTAEIPSYIITEDELQVYINKKIDSLGLRDKLNSAFEKFFGDALFDIQKITNIPPSMLEAFSWSQGENADFLAEGLYKGWPLRILPVKQRPFLKINGHFYCHDGDWLVESIYRLIQKKIIELKPSYKQIWADRQKEVTEEFPLNLFKSLLPGATILKSIHYQWPPTASPSKNWCETDGIVIYDDHLFVIEVKAGAFTYSSPASDFEAHLNSITALIQKPYNQAKRLFEYLSTAPTVPLYSEDANGEKVKCFEISLDKFRIKSSIGITLDHFTHIASNIEAYNINETQSTGIPFWSLAISDLMVFKDLFTSPHQFLHFIEIRTKAIINKTFKMADEVDHVGMYFKVGDYTQLANTPIGQHTGLYSEGYSQTIDEYFYNKLLDESFPIPKTSIHNGISKLVTLLENNKNPSQCHLSSILLSLHPQLQIELIRIIEELSSPSIVSKKPKSVSFRTDPPVTIFVSTPHFHWSDSEIRKQTISAMLITSKPYRIAVHIISDAGGRILSLDDTIYRRDQLQPTEIEYYKESSNRLSLKRLIKGKEDYKRGKIPRNDPCPCGSGLKYKKCCL